MLLVLVSRKVKGTPVGVEPTFNTCCADAGIAPTATTTAAIAAWTRRLRAMAPPPGSNTAARVRSKRVAGNAVPAYFHHYEIVVTLLRALQAIFMHMKEAVCERWQENKKAGAQSQGKGHGKAGAQAEGEDRREAGRAGDGPCGRPPHSRPAP